MTSESNGIPHFLITGATGNVGGAVIHQLASKPVHITAGVRNVDKARQQLGDRVNHYHPLDFATPTGLDIGATYQAILLVRPPQLGNAQRYFEPFIQRVSPQTRIVFLSVQGADRKGYLPHARIEALIERYQLDYVFLRPSYFMENLVTTLEDELSEHQRILLPAGKLKFNWVAVEDIARVAAKALLGELQEPAMEITSDQMFDFGAVVALINAECHTHFRYESPSLARYLLYGLRQGLGLQYIFVMLLLHYFPGSKNRPKLPIR